MVEHQNAVSIFQGQKTLSNDKSGPALHQDRQRLLNEMLCFVSLVAYLAADVEPRPNGGTWIDYTLGTLGALLIVWLSSFSTLTSL